MPHIPNKLNETKYLRCLKVGLSSSKKNCFISFNENPLKMMKNDFYFILKALFIATFWSCRKNGLIRKKKLSDCNGTRSHNRLVRKRTLNHLTKLAFFFFFFCELTIRLISKFFDLTTWITNNYNTYTA